VYGNEGFGPFLEGLRSDFPGVRIDYFQSNHCGAMIDKLHGAGGYGGIVLNAGGYTHHSVSLADAVKAIKTPVVEVHISNIYARGPLRSVSLLSPVCRAVVSGMGLHGYRYAVAYLLGAK
jgi:3-dehydroquinate dehydratase-2